MKRKKEEREEFDPFDMIGYEGNDIDGQEVGYDEIIRFTEKAVILSIDGDEEIVPRSQIMDANEDTIIVTYWFAGKKGW
jgi:hypothetical protein